MEIDQIRSSLTVCSCIDGDGNYCEKTSAWSPPLRKWYTITVVQYKLTNGQYQFQLLIDHSNAFRWMIQGKPVVYDNVKFYTGQSSPNTSILIPVTYQTTELFLRWGYCQLRKIG